MKVYLSKKFRTNFYHIHSRLHRDFSSLYYLQGTDVVTNIEQYFDFAHFVDIYAKSEIAYVKEHLKKKVIVNYFVRKLPKFSGISDVRIPFEDKRILNKCDLILVSCQADKMILIANEVRTPIEILTPALSEERYSKMSPLERGSFAQYAGLLKDEQTAFAVVNYRNVQDIQDLIALAESMKNLSFYVFGPKVKVFSTSGKISKMIKKAPKNLHFKAYVSEDIFKSAVVTSKVFIVTREAELEIINILEAMIAKTQVVTFNNHFTGDVLIDDVNCIVACSPEQMAEKIQSVLDGKAGTVEEAWREAREYDYDSRGKILKEIVKNCIE